MCSTPLMQGRVLRSREPPTPRAEKQLLRNPLLCPAALGLDKLQFSYQNHNVGLHTGHLSLPQGLVFLLFVPSAALPWAVGEKVLLQILKISELFTETGRLQRALFQILLCPWLGKRLSLFLGKRRRRWPWWKGKTQRNMIKTESWLLGETRISSRAPLREAGCGGSAISLACVRFPKCIYSSVR